MSVQVKLLGGFGVGPRRRTRGGGGSGAVGRRRSWCSSWRSAAAGSCTANRSSTPCGRPVLGRRCASAAQSGPLRAPRTRTTPDAVVLRQDLVGLLPGRDDVEVDVAEFTQSPRRALRAGDATLAAEALEWYGGPLLPEDLYEPWIDEPRRVARQQHLDLLRLLGRWDDLLAEEPTDEEAHLALARARADGGDVRGALRQLERLEQALRGSSAPLRARRPCGFAGARAKRGRRQRTARVGPRRGRDGCSPRRAAQRGGAAARQSLTTRARGAAAPCWSRVRRGREVGGPRPDRRPGSPQGMAGGARGAPRRWRALAVRAGARGAQRAVSPTPGAARRARRRLPRRARAGADRTRARRGPARPATSGCSSPPPSCCGWPPLDPGWCSSWTTCTRPTRRPCACCTTSRAAGSTEKVVAGAGPPRAGPPGPRGGDREHVVSRRRAVHRAAARWTPARRGACSWTVPRARPGRAEEIARRRRAAVPDARDGAGAGGRLRRGVAPCCRPRPCGPSRGSPCSVELQHRRAPRHQRRLDEDATYGQLELALAALVVESDEVGYRFRHALVREGLVRERAAARAVSRTQRVVAEALARLERPPRQVAHHYLAAGLGSRAVPYAVQAVEIAGALGAYRDGLTLVDGVRDHAGPDHLPGLLARRGDLLMALGEPGAVEAYPRRADHHRHLHRLVRAGWPGPRRSGATWRPRARPSQGWSSRATRPTRHAAGPGQPRLLQRRHRDCVGRRRRGARTAPRVDDPWQMVDLVATAGADRPPARGVVRAVPPELRRTQGQERLAAAVFDAHLCVAENLLYGPRALPRDHRRGRAAATPRPQAGALRGVAFATALIGEAALIMGDLEPRGGGARGGRRTAPPTRRGRRPGPRPATTRRGASGPGPQRRGQAAARRGASTGALVHHGHAPAATHLRDADHLCARPAVGANHGRPGGEHPRRDRTSAGSAP